MRWMVVAAFAGACGDNLPPVGTDASPTVDAVDAAPALLGITPGAATFGPVPQGAPSSPLSFVVTNVGGMTSGALAASIVGQDASAFTISPAGCSAPLNPGASCTLEVIFQSTFGTHDADLVVAAAPGGQVTAMLTGTALGEQFLTISPTVGSYGSVMVGQTATQSFTIFNAGGLPAGALTRALSGTDPTQFAFTVPDTCDGMTIAAGASCTLTIAFTPTTTGMKTAVVTVTQPAGAQVTGALAGTGT